MHYDRLTLEILLGSPAIPIADEVICLLNMPDEELPPATFHFDTVLDSTAVEKWKQSKKNIYETDAREVLESGRVDETEERRKRLKFGLADLMKLINDAEDRINPVVKIYDEDGDVRVVRKHDKVIERVKAFIRPDETLGEALDRLTEKLRDETELQPAAQVDPEREKLKREMRLVIDFLETAISEGDRWRDLLDLEQRVLRIQTRNDYRLEVLLALWDIPGERIRDKRPVKGLASEDPAPAAGPDARPAGEETPEKTPEAFVEEKTTKSLSALSPNHRARLDTLMEAMCVLLDDIEAGRADVSEIASDLSGTPQQSSELFMLLVKRAPTAKKHDQQTSDSLRSVLRRLLGSDYWPLGRGKTFKIKSWYTLRDEWRAGEVR